MCRTQLPGLARPRFLPISAVVVFVNLIVDLVYGVIDPRTAMAAEAAALTTPIRDQAAAVLAQPSPSRRSGPRSAKTAANFRPRRFAVIVLWR